VSLIEAVVALLILSTAVLVLLGGLATSIISSDMNRKNVTADAIARTWAENLQSSGVAYVPCTADAGAAYSAAKPANLGPYTATVTQVDYWDGSPTANFLTSCPAGGDQGAERITLSVLSTDHRGGARIQLVKRAQ
jgi:Tfp pilus assembly protein PilV